MPYFSHFYGNGEWKAASKKKPSCRKNRVSAEELIRISSSPLAVPLLAGPGAITSIMVFGDFTSLDKLVINLSSIFIALGASAFITLFGCLGLEVHKLNISTVMSRLVGILLAATLFKLYLTDSMNWNHINLSYVCL